MLQIINLKQNTIFEQITFTAQNAYNSKLAQHDQHLRTAHKQEHLMNS